MNTPSKHPLSCESRHTIEQVRSKMRSWYGVRDPDKWYREESERIRSGCLPDPLGITKFPSLEAYWEHKQQIGRWSDEQSPGAAGTSAHSTTT